MSSDGHLTATKPNQFVRPGNHIIAGIVGMPNSGKTSLFNLLTGEDASTSSNLFCTVDPNMASMEIADSRQDFIKAAFQASSVVGSSLTVVDTAGLVRGSYEGRALGNSTLEYVSRADVILHIVRAFEDDCLSHYEETVDPIRDIQIVDQELIERDLQTCTAAIREIELDVVRGFDGLTNEFRFETLLQVYACLAGQPYKLQDFVGSIAKKVAIVNNPAKGIPLRFKSWTQSELEIMQDLNFLTTKEMIYVVNLSMRNYLRTENRWMPPIVQFLRDQRVYYAPDRPFSDDLLKEGVLQFSIDFENRYRTACQEADGAEAVYLAANCAHRSMLPLMRKLPRHLFGWLRVYTANEHEIESYFIPNGTLAPQAGGFLKTEYERYFLSVEVLSFDDLEEMGTAADAFRSLKLRQQGTLYKVLESDILFYKIKL